MPTKPVVSTFYGFLGVAAPGSVPSYRSPEAGVQALARAVEYAEWRARPTGALPEFEVETEAARDGARRGRSPRSPPAVS